MFSKVLVANRGAIACRILRTLRKMGIASVGVYSEADRDARPVLDADEAFFLGPSPATQSYLSIDRILAAAEQTGAQAIHPGYGFLSENVEFARECARRGIVFIGPRVEQIEAFALKHTARALAERCGSSAAAGNRRAAGSGRGAGPGRATALSGDAEELGGRRRHRHARVCRRRTNCARPTKQWCG